MKVASLVAEVFRDLVANVSRSLSVIAILAGSLGVIALADAAAVSQFIQQARAFDASGATTITVSAPGRVNGLSCESLNKAEFVVAAAAIRESDAPIVLSLLPDSPVKLVEATSSISHVLRSSEVGNGGLVVSSEVVEQLSPLDYHLILATPPHRAEIASVYDYPSDGRRPGFSWAAFAPSEARALFDECWVRVRTPSAAYRPLLLNTLDINYSANASAPEISQLNTRYGFESPSSNQYLTRITRWIFLLSMLIGAVLGVGAVRVRRLELAARLHDGATRRDILTLVLLQQAILIAVATLITLGALSVFTFRIGPPDQLSLAIVTFAPVVAGAGGCFVGTFLGFFGVKESHLFRYFKDR